MMMITRGLILMALLGPSPCPGKTMDIADVFALRLVRDPQISPDGSHVAFVIETADIATDTRTTGVWIMPVGASAPRPLAVEHASSPRWSPDGRLLAWTAHDGEQHAIVVMDRATGQQRRLAEGAEPVANLAWSPDSSTIAFARRHQDGDPVRPTLAGPPDGASWNDLPVIADGLFWRADGAGLRPPGRMRVHLVQADGSAEPRMLADGGFDAGAGAMVWRDDRSLVVVADPRTGFAAYQRHGDSDLFVLPIDGGPPSILVDRVGADHSPASCGQALAWIGVDGDNRNHSPARLYVQDHPQAPVRTVADALDRDLESPAFWPDCRHLQVMFADRGSTWLAVVDPSGNVAPIASGLGTSLTAYAWGHAATRSANGRIVFNRTDPATPSALVVLEPGADEPQTLYDPNADIIGRVSLPSMREIGFRAPDGQAIQAWLMLPPGNRPGDRPPLVLDIHGGPVGDYGPRFDLEKTLLASRGYAILLVNPRGSSGYGTAFANAIDRRFPGDDVGDLLAGVDHVVAAGLVDPDRLFIMGISSGGTLTGWIIARDHRFRAAAMLYPAVNWESMITSDIMPYMPLVRFPGAPWEVPDLYRQSSPLAHVASVRTPTILITGEEDFRTPISETEQYFAALQWRGIPSRMVRMPGENHGIRRHPTSVWRKVALIDDWFARHLHSDPLDSSR